MKTTEALTLVQAARQVLTLLGSTAPESCGCPNEWQAAIEILQSALSQQQSTNGCQMEPLADEQIYECERIAAIQHNRHRNSIRGQQMTPADDLNWHFARAIEAAHGIGVTNG